MSDEERENSGSIPIDRILNQERDRKIQELEYAMKSIRHNCSEHSKLTTEIRAQIGEISSNTKAASAAAMRTESAVKDLNATVLGNGKPGLTAKVHTNGFLVRLVVGILLVGSLANGALYLTDFSKHAHQETQEKNP